MNIVSKKIEDLKPYKNNPRKHPEKSVEFVANSIKEFGFKVPILIDKNNEIIAGHTRLLASQKLGLEKVPCIVVDDLTPKQVRAFRIADNKASEFSEWDDELLSVEFEELKELDFDIGLTGFSADELSDIFSEEEPEIAEDDYEVVLPEEPKTKLGDIYQLGRHRLMCGDSTDIDAVERLMGVSKADLVITDPPYNVAVNDENVESLKARNRRLDGLKVANDKMSDADFKQFLLDVFGNYFILLKDGGSIYVFYADSEVVNFVSAFTEAGFHFAQNCIWNKQQFVMTRKDYHYKHEPILYGWKKGVAHQWYSDRKQSSVWDFDRPFKSEYHPTMKPINLVAYPIQNSSKQGDLIVDLFGGSGSTLIACEQLNRTCYMMELDLFSLAFLL